METQRRLFDLPTDIMSELTSMLELAEIYRLLLTGNGQLTNSLSRFGAVTQLKVNMYEAWSPAPKSWPVLINLFSSLRKLTIFSPSVLFTHFDNQHLPSTLTYLDIRYCNIPSSILETDVFNVGKILPNLQTLRTRIDIDESRADFISSCPQKLTFLEISEFQSRLPLPSSLTHIRMYINEYSDINGCLPPHLIRLKLGMEVIKSISDLAPLLPSTLEWLALISETYDDGDVSHDIIGLPPNLTRLKIDVGDYTDWDISHLPTRLTQLSFGSFNLNLLDQLPSSLLSLSIEMLDGEDDPKSIPELFASLPRRLTRLSIGDAFSGFDLEGSMNMPPNMTHCETGFCNFLDEASILSLPSKTLSYLHIGEIEYNITNLPEMPQLKELRMYKAPLSFNLLNHLSLHSPFLKTLIVSDGSVKSPELKKLQSILGSHHEEASNHPIPLIHRFSSHLRNVDIGGCDFLGDGFILHMLPSSINVLNLGDISGVTNKSISIMKTWTNLGYLNFPNARNITSTCFKDLPRQLTSLNLDRTENIEDQDIAHLPPSLTEIYFRSAIHLTNACVSFLPPSTTRFMAGLNENFTSEIIHHLPPLMRFKTSNGRIFEAANITINKAEVIREL